MRKLLYLSVTLIGLASCDGYTTNEFIVVNDSSERIILNSELFTESADSNLTVIPPGSEVMIYFWSSLGGNSSPAMENLVETPDSMFLASTLISSDGDTLTKPFHNIRAWDIKSKQRTKLPSQWEHVHRFIVEESDWE